MSSTVPTLYYFSPRLNAHYGLHRPSVEAEATYLLFSNEALRIVAPSADEVYTRTKVRVNFMEDYNAPGPTPAFLGTVELYTWEQGNAFGSRFRILPRQVAFVGRHQDGCLAFIRIYDWLGGEYKLSEDLVKVLYTRSRFDGKDPLHEVELVMEVGSMADLKPTRPTEATEASQPTTAFLSRAGSMYYDQPELGAVAHWTNISWIQPYLVYENTTVTFEEETNIRVGALCERLRFEKSDPQQYVSQSFLDGHLRYFEFKENPDDDEGSEPVHRIAVLGLKNDGTFGFLRIFDSLGSNLPKETVEGVLPIEFMTSHALDGFGPFNRELVQEVGSPLALLDSKLREPVLPDVIVAEPALGRI